MLDLDHAFDVAIQTARKAGDVLKERFEQYCADENAVSVSTKTSDIDLVTAADGEVQRLVMEEIHASFPGHRFIGEEEGSDALGDPESPYAWIIDPLDGTLNFVHRKRNFGTMMALRGPEGLLIGIIYRPFYDELFHGARGKGSFRNDAPITLRKTKSMDDAVLCSNLIHRTEKDEKGRLIIDTPYCASLENYGNAAEEIGEVLNGRNDGVFFIGVGLWDAAPGCLLIEEAGGKGRYETRENTSTSKNSKISVNSVISTEPIFEELCDFVWKKEER